jgi:hypothetical protein
MFGMLVVVLGRDPIARLEFSLGHKSVAHRKFANSTPGNDH